MSKKKINAEILSKYLEADKLNIAKLIIACKGDIDFTTIIKMSKDNYPHEPKSFIVDQFCKSMRCPKDKLLIEVKE